MDPLAQFGAWLTEARRSEGRWSDALNLATATRDGRPSVRAVMLRGFDDDGLVFFTDEDSRKGRELVENPWAAASFAWAQANRQVQLEGPVARLAEEEAEIVFADRPADRRLPLWAWRQDAEVPGADELRRRLARCREDLAGGADRPSPLLGGLPAPSRDRRVLGGTARGPPRTGPLPAIGRGLVEAGPRSLRAGVLSDFLAEPCYIRTCCARKWAQGRPPPTSGRRAGRPR